MLQRRATHEVEGEIASGVQIEMHQRGQTQYMLKGRVEGSMFCLLQEYVVATQRSQGREVLEDFGQDIGDDIGAEMRPIVIARYCTPLHVRSEVRGHFEGVRYHSRNL